MSSEGQTSLDRVRNRISDPPLLETAHMLIDTHAHLDFPDFANDLEDVLRRADEADVKRVITIGTSIESSKRAIALAEKYPSVYAAIGVHPSSAHDAEDDVITPLRELAKHPRVVAIGETGLDYHHLPSEEVAKEKQVQVMTALRSETDEEIEAQIRDGACKSKQASLFQQQLDLAVELGLNVVIHQRDAWEDTLEVLRAYTGKVRGVFHCFGGSLEQANEVLGLDQLVSFTGIVTFKNGVAVRQVAADIPLWKFMVETDCPFLAPTPFRGKRCEPAYTRIVAETIAVARGVSFNEIAEATTETAEQFFRFNRA
jgi:TatD DNase family protein